MLADRVKQINESITLAVSSKAKQMKSRGIDVIGFGAGEPDFDTPLNIREKAKQAISQGFTKYTPALGMPELREAIAEKLKRENGLSYSPKEIIVSCGAKYALFEAIMALVNPGEEVLIPSPYWVSYPEMVKIARGRAVFIDARKENSFKITASQLEEKISKKTKLLILNSPSNPAGTVYTEKELERLSEVILKKNIFLISDEIYEKLVYEGNKHRSIASFSSKIKERTILINGVSKSYSMTGWRIGYAAAIPEIIKAMGNIQSHSTSNPASISQMAALEAISGPQDKVEEMRSIFEKRRDLMLKLINGIPELSCVKPQGAFYCFVDISEYLRTNNKGIDSSLSFADRLLEEKSVAVVPGAAFGDSNFIRLSFATSEENIEKGLNRIKEFVS